MHVILVGADPLAAAVARRLHAEGCTLAVIDREEARLEELAAGVDAYCLEGSGASPSLLAQAGLDRAAGLLALSAAEEQNLLAGGTALALGAPRVLVRVEDPAFYDEERLHPAFPRDLIPLRPWLALARELLWRALHPEAAEAYALLEGSLYLVRLRPGHPRPREAAPLPLEGWYLLPGTIPASQAALIALGPPALLAALARLWLPRPLRGLTLITPTRAGALHLARRLPEARILAGPVADLMGEVYPALRRGPAVVGADPSPAVNLHFLKTLGREGARHGVAVAGPGDAPLFFQEGFLSLGREEPLLSPLFRHLLPGLRVTASLPGTEIREGILGAEPRGRAGASLPAGALPLARAGRGPRLELFPPAAALRAGDRVALWYPPAARFR